MIFLKKNRLRRENENAKLILIGDGPLLNKYKKLADDLKVNAVFLGRRDYIEALKIFSQCDVALHNFVDGATQSITNKAGDYATLGVPVVNSLESKEYQDLLLQYNAGINIPCEDVKKMAESILYLMANEDERLAISKGSRKLAEDKFDRNKTYKRIVSLINNMN